MPKLKAKTVVMALRDLDPAPYNPREISKEALEGLQESVERFGQVQAVVWNRRSKRIVGGHQRVKAMKALGWKEAEVYVVDLGDAEEKTLNLTLNNPNVAGDFTAGAKGLLREIKLQLPELYTALKLPALAVDLRNLVSFKAKQGGSEEKAPEPPKKPVSKLGDLWLLGKHRLLCGDSTMAEDVGRLLGKEVPALMATDPPYGVDYDPDRRTKAAEKGQIGYGTKRVGKFEGDSKADWGIAWAFFPGDIAYVWHASLRGPEVWKGLEDAGFEIRAQIIWAKPSFRISQGHYHWQHEPAWYAVRKGKTARWNGDRSQTTLWQVKGIGPMGQAAAEAAQTPHSTQKPVDLWERPIVNHLEPGETLFDPFLGSGTSIIAAEKLERRCLALEIDPAYVDVAVERWQAFSGLKAKRQKA